MVARFLNDSNREFCNCDGEQQINNRFKLAKKKNLYTRITLFSIFLSRCCTTAISKFHAPALWSW